MSKKFYKVHYWLKNQDGAVVDTSEGGEPMSFADGDPKIIAGWFKALDGRSAGDRIEATIPAELAYGPHNESLVTMVPASVFDGVDSVEVGMKFQTNTGEDSQIVKVVEVTDDGVVVDANHPLAGIDLTFEFDVIEIREIVEGDL